MTKQSFFLNIKISYLLIELTSLTDDQADFLSKHKGSHLYLEGLKNFDYVRVLSKYYKGTLYLPKEAEAYKTNPFLSSSPE